MRAFVRACVRVYVCVCVRAWYVYMPSLRMLRFARCSDPVVTLRTGTQELDDVTPLFYIFTDLIVALPCSRAGPHAVRPSFASSSCTSLSLSTVEVSAKDCYTSLYICIYTRASERAERARARTASKGGSAGACQGRPEYNRLAMRALRKAGNGVEN
ncbi:hypothetical protein PUN28_011260 [Cardiocondyla obscurior]|uniref:Uncharacterized protein n=1 Tax=Cardiocondyla obscurior TaxID=286306 RepID=A0AAW2FM83_9HYME